MDIFGHRLGIFEMPIILKKRGKNMDSFKKYLAEFIGTCVLVTVACGVAVVLGTGTWLRGGDDGTAAHGVQWICH